MSDDSGDDDRFSSMSGPKKPSANRNQESTALAEVSSSSSSKSSKPEGQRLGNSLAAPNLPTVAAANEVLV
jgi:hypothetical protein